MGEREEVSLVGPTVLQASARPDSSAHADLFSPFKNPTESHWR
jgi:hypothetical protein